MLANDDGWRGKRRTYDPERHEARTPAQIVAVLVVVGLILAALIGAASALSECGSLLATSPDPWYCG